MQNNSKWNPSSDFLTWLVQGPTCAKKFCTKTLNNMFFFCIFFYVNTIGEQTKQGLGKQAKAQDRTSNRCEREIGEGCALDF
jgi:hypothetical protein